MRIIKDSDDEFDDDDLEGDIAPKTTDASPAHGKALASPLPCEPGTGSTDSLKRNIEAAHRAHFQSEPIASIPTAPLQHKAPESSASDHRSKRRKTTVDGSSPFSGTGSQRKKPPKTYGRSKTIFSSPYVEQSQEKSTSREFEDVTDKPWILDGDLRDNYAAHDPMSLFPDQSSTVPNATLTQQRLLAEVMAPGFLGIEAEINRPPYNPQESSVPWSDFLKTSSGNTEVPSDLANAPEQPSFHLEEELTAPSGAHSLDPTPTIAQTPRQGQTPNEINLSQYSQRSPSVRLKNSPLQNEVLRNDIDPKEIMPPPVLTQDNEDPVANHLTPSRPSNNNKKEVVEEKRRSPRGHDRSQDEPIIVSAPSKAKKKSSSVPNSEDDLLSIGLPKEQYKPRPSRSRSLRLNVEEPVDYSVRPEKAGKKGTRRSKTLGGCISTPQKVQQICDMGFSPETTQRVLKENNGDVSQTVDWLVTNGAVSEEDELAPSRPSTSKGKARKSSMKPESPGQSVDQTKDDAPSSQKKNRRVSFSASTDPSADHANVPKEATTDADSTRKQAHVPESPSLKVRVMIPPKSKGTLSPRKAEEQQTKVNGSQKADPIDAPSKKAKRRKTTLDQPEPILEEHQIIAPTPTKEKKRGRGRPRKEANPPLSNGTIHEEQHGEEAQGARDESKRALQEIEHNVSPTIEAPKSKDADEQTETTLPPITEPPVSTPPRKPTPAESSRTPEKQSRPARNSHSPLNKGKVPYRVGLSKRARIAPLLRTMKK